MERARRVASSGRRALYVGRLNEFSGGAAWVWGAHVAATVAAAVAPRARLGHALPAGVPGLAAAARARAGGLCQRVLLQPVLENAAASAPADVAGPHVGGAAARGR